MASQRPQRHALVLSCEVPGEEPMPGARQNAEKLSKFFRRADVPAQCVYGGRLSFNRVIEALEDFLSSKCDLHILCGIFHGHAGSWKLSDGTTLRLRDIVEQWDLAKELGTAQHLLIVSDACESGQMVNEAALLGRRDIAVQASCSPCNPTSDTVGETFTELLLWKLHGQKIETERDERICSIEMALLNFGPCYYCVDVSNYIGWVFVDEDGSYPSSPCFSLDADSSDMSSPELPSPELPSPELLTPELLTPKLLTPKLPSPELLTPELLTPKLLTPKLLTPELLTPEPASGHFLGLEDVPRPFLAPVLPRPKGRPKIGTHVCLIINCMCLVIVMANHFVSIFEELASLVIVHRDWVDYGYGYCSIWLGRVTYSGGVIVTRTYAGVKVWCSGMKAKVPVRQLALTGSSESVSVFWG